jgi:hypothetical protein
MCNRNDKDAIKEKDHCSFFIENNERRELL